MDEEDGQIEHKEWWYRELMYLVCSVAWSIYVTSSHQYLKNLE
jgi:hypothetical protein